MELSIEKLRLKQRKQFKMRVIAIILLVITSIIIAILIVNKKAPVVTQENNNQNNEIQTHTICINSNLPENLIDNIQNIDFNKLTENKELEYKVIVTNDINNEITNNINDKSISDTNCDTTITRNLTDETGYTIIWSKLYIPIARIDSNIKSFTIEEFTKYISSQTIDNSDETNTSKNIINSDVINNENSNSTSNTNNENSNNLINNTKTAYLIWDNQNTNKFIKTKFNSVSGQTYQTKEEVLKEVINSTTFVAIIPFESLTPEYKVISINNQSPLQKNFNKITYPLTDSYWIKSDNSELSTNLQRIIQQSLGKENYDSNKLNDVIITGNSAIGARSQYIQLTDPENNQDPIYPIRGIADTLRNASISHISNDSSFADNCTQSTTASSLCGLPESIDQLIFAGIDIVGMTGEHIMDAGRTPFEKTLKLYQANNIKYFAAGYNYNEAHTAQIMDLGNLKIAFLGFNFVPPYSYGAGKTYSGNSQYTKAIMEADIAKAQYELKADFIFVDMQWTTELSQTTTPNQIKVAKATLDAGANIITGLNPIYTQGYDHFGNKIVFYALGNTLYEPYNEASRSAIMVRHIFYDKTYLGFEIIPTYINNDFQTVLADGERKATILNNVMKKSNLYFLDNL